MDALLVRIAERITSGADPLLSPSEALELARLPESATLDILSVAGLARAARKPAAAFTCGIINAKSGRCPENCAFCAQSAHHQTDSPVYPLYDTDTLLRRAEELAANNVDRFGIVTSGTAPSDRDFDALCESALRIGREVKIGLCASLGLLTLNALTASDTVLVPIQCEYYALEGLGQLINTIGLVQTHFNPLLLVSTMLVTMFDKRTLLSREVYQEVKTHYPSIVLDTTIPRTVKISEAPSFGETVITYDPRGLGAISYREAAYEINERSQIVLETIASRRNEN